MISEALICCHINNHKQNFKHVFDMPPNEFQYSEELLEIFDLLIYVF